MDLSSGPASSGTRYTFGVSSQCRLAARCGLDSGCSNLPIEPALSQGATEIIALDLSDPRPIGPAIRGFGPFLFQLIHTVEQRQVYLEKKLAAAYRVPVHHVPLQAAMPVAVWQFERSLPLIDRGYDLMSEYLRIHPNLRPAP